MTRKGKPDQSTPAVQTTDSAVEEIRTLDAITDELNAATPPESAPNNDAVDFSELAKQVDAALTGIATEQAKVEIARLLQVPYVGIVVDRVTTVHGIYTKKTTTTTTKNAITKAFPVIESARGLNDAILSALAQPPANLLPSTAKTLVALAKAPDVVVHREAKHFSVTVGYELARANLTNADLEAAGNAGLVATNVSAWLDARAHAKTIKAQWPVFAEARRNVTKWTKQAQGQPDGAAGNATAQECTEKAKIARAEANTAWSAITDARDAILKSPFPHAMRELDEDTFTVVEAEVTRRAEAEKAKQNKANEEADDRIQKARANADAKEKAAQEAEAKRVLANDTARILSDEIEAKKKAMANAEEAAIETLRAELAELNRQSAKAIAELNEAKAEADKTAADATTAKAKAALIEKQAVTQATRTANQAVTQTAAQTPTVTRPAASSYEALAAEYRRMTVNELRAQMTDIATALWRKGHAYMADWVTHGAALDAGLLEPDKAK